MIRVEKGLKGKGSATTAGNFLAIAVITGILVVLLTSVGQAQTVSAGQKEKTMSQTKTAPVAATDESIRPFKATFPDAQLTDLRNRIKATIWPERETVTDESQGVQLATM